MHLTKFINIINEHLEEFGAYEIEKDWQILHYKTAYERSGLICKTIHNKQINIKAYYYILYYKNEPVDGFDYINHILEYLLEK